MASDPRAPRDVRPVLAAGLCVMALVLAWPLVRPARKPTAPPAPPPAVAVVPRSASGGERPATVPVAEAPAAATSVSAAAARRQASAREPSRATAREEGEPVEKTGIGVFPPPGTSPPLPGIMVPDDYELPPGYVRHYQTTDDGERLPPILMFHPDFQPIDDRGRPIPLPADRVVPPELAPPGMPRDVLAVPRTEVPFVEPPPQ
jgi:hypothetical protein